MQPLKATDPRAVGPYRLAGRLGSGGMGVVYLGVSPTADRFAVKMINSGLVSDDEFRRRFSDEVDTLRTVYGKRVARLERADLMGEAPWLSVEYVPGRTLQTQIEARGALDARSGAMLGALLAEGLRAVHDAGLVHRDLKPANVMLGPDGPIVIDFGLARLRDRDEHLTGTGHPVGTLAYMSPEQARGERDLTTATDVYALGATLVYAMTGHTVYTGASAYVLLQRIGAPDDLPNTAGVPGQLRPLVDAMLAFEPATRPGRQAVHDRLLEVALAGGVSAEEVRQQLTTDTFVDEAIAIPPEWADQVEDDTDLADDDGPTELVAAPPPLIQADKPDPVREPVERAPVDVRWLVDEMRDRYARQAAL
jgi:serine/threonine protein kinase